MFETVAGPASVPTGVHLVETAEGLAVDWEWPKERPWGPASPGPVLEAFLGIASHPEPGEAVRALVLDFGPLGLCQEHSAQWGAGEHKACHPLKPEPVDLWQTYGAHVRHILHVRDALAAGRVPESEFEPARAAGWAANARGWRLALERERVQQRGERGEAELRELFDSMGVYLEALYGQGDKLGAFLAELRKEKDWADYADYMVDQVNARLATFPPTLQLAADPETGELRPVFQAPASILGRVYMELAGELFSSVSFTFCSHCARAYRVNRRPKTGQRRFCPACRAASVPKRLHMRDKRSRR